MDVTSEQPHTNWSHCVVSPRRQRRCTIAIGTRSWRAGIMGDQARRRGSCTCTGAAAAFSSRGSIGCYLGLLRCFSSFDRRLRESPGTVQDAGMESIFLSYPGCVRLLSSISCVGILTMYVSSSFACGHSAANLIHWLALAKS
jgi:hypothetical protein